MPDQPSWIHRLPQITQALEAPDAPPFLDRPAIERLFGLRRRQSIALLRRLGGYQVGKTFLVDRAVLLASTNACGLLTMKPAGSEGLANAWPRLASSAILNAFPFPPRPASSTSIWRACPPGSTLRPAN